MKRLIKSKRKDMLDREYTEYVRGEAIAWANAVAVHVRDNNPAEAGRCARLAARWALKLTGRKTC